MVQVLECQGKEMRMYSSFQPSKCKNLNLRPNSAEWSLPKASTFLPDTMVLATSCELPSAMSKTQQSEVLYFQVVRW